MRGVRLVYLLACLAIVPACERNAAPGPIPEPAVSARTESPLGWLEISLPTAEMRTVDEISVSITLEREPGVVAGALVFDAASAGWTVESAGAGNTVRSADGVLRTVWVFKLQPFLEGEYTIPPAVIELEAGTQPVRLTTPAQTVTVSSVFAAGEEPQLAGPRPIAVPEAPADERPYWFAGAVAGIIAVIVAGALVSRRLAGRKSPPAGPDLPLDARGRARAMQDRLTARVVAICNGPKHAPTTEQLNTHIDKCPWIRDREGLKRLLGRLEESVYGPTTPREDELADLDARTTRMLASLDPSTPSGEVA